MDKRCKDGWFLMAEGASVDKAMHPLDFDRGLSDVCFPRTIQSISRNNY